MIKMDKKLFIDELEKGLKVQNVTDIEGILEEYEDHFKFKMADGYAEAEIVARLGSPQELARQYSPAEKAQPRGGGSKVIIAIGLVFADIVVGLLLLLFFIWAAVLGVSAIACLAAGVSLAANINIMSLLPAMPFPGALIMAVAFLALAVLAGAGTYFCWRYAVQLTRSYIAWHKRCLQNSSKRQPPALAAAPLILPKTRRILRRTTRLALFVFGISFVLGYIVLSLQAGALEFWHVWGWFAK
jgi:uncharacterized membrane protein